MADMTIDPQYELERAHTLQARFETFVCACGEECVGTDGPAAFAEYRAHRESHGLHLMATKVCAECGVERAPGDPDYSPVQVVLGGAIGWYSGDDGEFCGPCMAALIRRANS